MIDEKKIEEAAFEEYPLNSDGNIIGRNGFKEGVNWAINELVKGLWHPSSEKPKKGRVFLYKTTFDGYGLNQIIDRNEWKYIIKYQKATQWLYIDDLLPKKGGDGK